MQYYLYIICYILYYNIYIYYIEILYTMKIYIIKIYLLLSNKNNYVIVTFHINYNNIRFIIYIY